VFGALYNHAAQLQKKEKLLKNIKLIRKQLKYIKINFFKSFFFLPPFRPHFEPKRLFFYGRTLSRINCLEKKDKT